MQVIPFHAMQDLAMTQQWYDQMIALRRPSWDYEAISCHTALVLRHYRLALLLWVVGGGEQHALVALGLFFVTDAAGL
jgi:hypothetical protein